MIFYHMFARLGYHYSKVSVYDYPARTNNITETFHNVAGRKFGKTHENVWSFLDNLRKLIIDEELKLKRLKTTETSGHRTSIKNKNRDNKILEIQKYFAAGRLHLNHFLRLFNDRCENFVKAKLLSKEDNSHIYNSTSDEEYDSVYSETKSNTLHNTEYDAKINTERKTPLQELLNREERNNSRVKCHKRRQELLNTNKENFSRGNENAPKQNNFQKLPESYVVLQKINEASKKVTVNVNEPSKKRCERRI